MADSEGNIVRLDSRRNAHRSDSTRQLLTIVFTDLVDSTKLQSDFGDTEANRVTEIHRGLVREELAHFNSREIKWMGDSCLATFPKPSDAILFAVRLQAKMREAIEDEPNLPLVRIGLHMGEIVVNRGDDEDVFGLQVSEASRVMSLARGNQVYCTRTVYEAGKAALRRQSRIRNPLALRWERHGLFELKGSPEPVEICEIGEADFAPFEAPEANEKCWPVPGGESKDAAPPSKLPWAVAIGVIILAVAVAAVDISLPRGEPEAPAAVEEVASKDKRVFPILLRENAPVAPSGITLNINLDMSPDGKRLVYRTSDGSTVRLAIRELDQIESTVLAGTEDARFPFFSPDGQWVGYFAPTEQKLKKISVAGGTPIEICEAFFYTGASWGTDDFIVFSNGGQALMRVSANGGVPEKLTAPDPEKGETFHSHPHILPGNTHALFQISKSISLVGAKVALLSLETNEYTILIEEAGLPKYASSGHMIVSTPGELLAQPFDVESLTFSGPPVAVAEYAMAGADGTIRHYGFSRGGTLAYIPSYEETKNHSRLAWLDRTGEIELLDAAPREFRIARVGPDGRVAASARQTSSEDIYILEGADATRFTFNSAEDWHPLWSPDGAYIAFSSSRNGIFNLFWRRADGTGEVEQLTRSFHYQWPHAWGDAGATLVYVEQHPETGYDIWGLTMEGERATRPLLKTPYNENNPDISPDGKWIAYQSNESGQYEIVVKSFPDMDGFWQISEEGGNQARWSNDGSELFFRHGSQLLKSDIRTEPSFSAGTPEVLFESDDVVLGSEARNYDISLDDQRFLMLKSPEEQQGSAANREIILVENWFEELNRLAPPDAP